MSDRDCENCKHHTKKGCDSWDCEFERRMARKEIIEMLKVLKEQALKSHNDTAIIDVKKDSFIYVMNVAINSLEIDERYELEYEQIEPCEDAISRQAVLDYIDKMPSELTTDGRRMIRRRTLEEYISDTLPSVNPQEPKTGHWIEKDGYDGDTYYDCSECGESFCLIDGTPTDNLYNFCPNCGAKMIESQESEDKE